MLEKEIRTAKNLLGTRSDVVSVAPTATVLDALAAMAARNIGAVLVVENGQILGILSERDYARKVELKGLHAKDVLVRQIMTADVISVAPDSSVDECVRVMGQRRIRHLPVVDSGKVAGMLSARDVLEEALTVERHLVRDLEKERLISTTDTGTY